MPSTPMPPPSITLLPSPSAATAPPPPLEPTSPMAMLLPATTGLTLLEPSTLPRGRLRPTLRLRLIPSTDTVIPDLDILA